MRGFESVSIPILVFAMATTLLVGQAAPNLAHADKEPYASARDCLRSVEEVESQRETQEDGLSAEIKNLLSQARDLCIQSRYDQVQNLLGKVTQMAGSD